MIQQFNAIHASLVEEINDVREKITSSETNNSRSNFVYADGSVVLPITDSGFDMIGSEEAFGDDPGAYSDLIGSSHSMVEDNAILKIPRATKALLATYANMMVQEENIGKFYGMLIVDGDKKLNPMHPIIATMITAGEISLSETFTIIVYPYRSRIRPNMDNVGRYSKEIVGMTAKIRSTQYLPTIAYRANRNMNDDVRGMSENVNTSSISFSESGARVSHAVIPVHLTTISIVYPYYGLIHSQGGGGDGYQSRHLYPCLSGNIDTMGSGRGQTCVGDLNSSAFSSLYVLSNMNINSMYFSEIISRDSYDFISACQSVSAEFLAAAAGLSFDEEDPEEENETPEEAPENSSDTDEVEDETPVEEAQEEESCDVCVA